MVANTMHLGTWYNLNDDERGFTVDFFKVCLSFLFIIFIYLKISSHRWIPHCLHRHLFSYHSSVHRFTTLFLICINNHPPPPPPLFPLNTPIPSHLFHVILFLFDRIFIFTKFLNLEIISFIFNYIRLPAITNWASFNKKNVFLHV